MPAGLHAHAPVVQQLGLGAHQVRQCLARLSTTASRTWQAFWTPDPAKFIDRRIPAVCILQGSLQTQRPALHCYLLRNCYLLQALMHCPARLLVECVTHKEGSYLASKICAAAAKGVAKEDAGLWLGRSTCTATCRQETCPASSMGAPCCFAPSVGCCKVAAHAVSSAGPLSGLEPGGCRPPVAQLLLLLPVLDAEHWRPSHSSRRQLLDDTLPSRLTAIRPMQASSSHIGPGSGPAEQKRGGFHLMSFNYVAILSSACHSIPSTASKVQMANTPLRS